MSTAKINLYYRSYLLPWDDAGDQEQRFRTILQRIGVTALVLCILMSLLPLPERDPQLKQSVPPRLARLLIEKPAPIPLPPPPVVQPEPQQRQEPVPPTERATESKTRPAAERKTTAREKAGKAGLLPFVDQLAELRDSKALNSITSGGTSYTGAVGDSPQVERALITSKAGVGSGGINTAGMSRNTGGSGLGGRSTTQVSSGLAALGGGGSGGASEDGGAGGQRASRSREEIERVFDQNKGAIYALYNRALRENPELQGKLVLKLTIEASGEVSQVEIISSELADQELERKLVQRIRMFRFLEKDVPPVTTTKPIDFFPA
ncbi:MAG: AgmX/PglI C-terminal domain-containing protein [Gammaproteobacteria bacterium]